MLRLVTLFFIIVVVFTYTREGVALQSNNEIGKLCKPVNCGGKMKTCPYGYHKQDGCEICKCLDPCNPPGKAILCGSNKRCFVDKKIDGTFVARCGLPKSKRSKDACGEEKVVGLCKAAFPRFYYNASSKKCEKFIYGGCGGNNNNFESEKECQIACVV